MRKTDRKWLSVTAVLALTLAAGANLSGQEANSDAARLDQLEAEMAAMRESVGCEPNWLSSCFYAQSCGLYGGYSFSLVSPFFHDSTKATSYSFVDNNGTDTWVGEAVEFHYDHEITPKIWLGWVGASGFGGRARYWIFDHEGDTSTLAPQGDSGAEAWVPDAGYLFASGLFGETLVVGDSLKVYTVDLEITQQMHFLPASFQFGGGLRIAGIETTYHAQVLDDQAAVTEGLLFERNFEGAGPTMSLEYRREIATSGFAVLAGLRGSVLFGERTAVGQETDLFWDEVDITSTHDNTSVLGIGEVELGLEYARQLDWGRAFFRGTYEGQLWLDGGTPNSTEGDLGFEGFGLAVGFDR